MRAAGVAGLWVVVVVVSAMSAAQVERPTPGAQERFDATRLAIGGAQRIAALKALSLSGTLRVRNQYFGKVPEAKAEFVTHPFRTSILFPDHYLEQRDAEVALVYSGFAGSVLLNRSVLSDGRVGAGHMPPDMIETERANCAYLVLALVLRIDSAAGFHLLGSSEDTLRFKNAAGVEVTMDLDPGTSMPRRLRWEARRRAPGGAITGTVPIVMEIGDHRPVGQLQLPHRLTMMREGAVDVERTLTSIELDPPITPADFKR